MSINRSVPSRAVSFRSGNAAASPAPTKRIVTGWFSQTTRLASASAAAMSPRDNSRSRSIVDERGAEVKADGSGAEEPVERRRQHVLAAVLLHVIEAPRPVDRAPDLLSGLRFRPRSASSPSTWTDRAVVFVEDVHDAECAE